MCLRLKEGLTVHYLKIDLKALVPYQKGVYL
jgi:hypothetical protein